MGIFADVLFTKTQQRVLAVLYGQPNRSFYANEIIALAACGSGAVQRELASLEESGLVHSWRAGNQKHYQVDRDAAIFEELHSIVVKTFGAGDLIRAALQAQLPELEAVFIHGDAVTGTVHASSGIDLIAIVAAPAAGLPALRQALSELTGALGREVRPVFHTADQFGHLWRTGDAALRAILEQPKIFIKGSEADLIKLAQLP
ncbi:transcriptional regulator [Pseudoduganella sp. UC29_71]|uniref:transcriptional regulator n=1 Tax=Pseudoduganella sp. UC29_71 TaxID=3350174 RepID=UPI00366EC274